MAQVKPEYEVVEDFNKTARRLIDKYPSVFQEVNMDMVRCYSIVNKSRKEGKALWSIKSCPSPFDLDCPYKYGVVIYQEDWVELSEKHKALLVSDVLFSLVGADTDVGKVNQFDLKDYRPMIRTFGADYLFTDNVPDILNEDIQWKID